MESNGNHSSAPPNPSSPPDACFEAIQHYDPSLLILHHNFNIPGDPEHYYTIPKREPEVAPVDFPHSVTHCETIQELNSHGRKLRDIALLSDCGNFQIENLSGFFATCGGIMISVYNNPNRSQLESWQVYLDMDNEEDFHAICWGLLPLDDGDFRPIIAAGGTKGVVKIIDPLKVELEKELFGHMHIINELKFHPDNHTFLLSCSDDLTVRLWNVVKDHQVGIFYGNEGHIAGVNTIDWHHLGEAFVSGGKDSEIKLWRITPKVASAMQASHDHDSRVQISQSGVKSKLNPFKTVSVQNPIFSTHDVHDSIIDCIKFYGNLIISKGQFGKIIVWKATPEKHLQNLTILYVLKYREVQYFPMKFSISKKWDILAVGGAFSESHVFRLLWSRTDCMTVIPPHAGRSSSIVRKVVIDESTQSILSIEDNGCIVRYNLNLL
jgi:polycomb protein EED